MNHRRIVVKAGSSSLTDETGRLDEARISRLVDMLAELREEGHEVLLVSSGAIAAGLGKLGWQRESISMPEKQAAAAVGQGLLINTYEQMFAERGIVIGQLLLTRSDVEVRNRFLNIRNTTETLLAHRIIPIVNENDTVAVEEIRFGDNDTLGSLVAVVAEADLVVLLTDIDGMYTSDPRLDESAERLLDVWEITEELEQMAGGTGTVVGTGGMRSKLAAARIAMDAGIDLVVAASTEPDVLARIVRGEDIGTQFHARKAVRGR
ncbi:glutamate 5-kinase, partial [Tumebacillus flagellatus]|uniref:Glutamate 5-kinase n=1 Tax=Tumebacillus flagellatus TaxID=1157490 RepID=A0A074LTM1_9BACL